MKLCRMTHPVTFKSLNFPRLLTLLVPEGAGGHDSR